MDINLFKFENEINMRDLVSNLNHAEPLVTLLLLAVAVAVIIYQVRKYREDCN
jgi:hypothetical protein